MLENEEVLSVCLDDLDRDYDVPPSIIDLDYNSMCNKYYFLLDKKGKIQTRFNYNIAEDGGFY